MIGCEREAQGDHPSRQTESAATPCGRPTSGRVIRIHAGQSHGFIRDADSREVFFHRSDTTFGTFNKLIVGDKVAFELIEDRVSGPRATGVRLGNRARS